MVINKMTIDKKNMVQAIIGFKDITRLSDDDKKELQKAISAFQRYALHENDDEALEELVDLAYEIGKQERLGYDLTYRQNTDESIQRIIEKIRQEKFICECRGE